MGDRGPPNYHPRFFLNGETDGDECCTKFEKPPYIIDFFFRVGSMNCPISLDSCGDSPMFLASLLNLFQRWPPTVTVLDKMTIIVVMCYYCYYIYIYIHRLNQINTCTCICICVYLYLSISPANLLCVSIHERSHANTYTYIYIYIYTSKLYYVHVVIPN